MRETVCLSAAEGLGRIGKVFFDGVYLYKRSKSINKIVLAPIAAICYAVVCGCIGGALLLECVMPDDDNYDNY